jgi:hypothetical protein
MSDQAAPEPTMEEILASIRRIISEDDSPAGLGAAAEDGGWRPPPAATDAGSTVIGDAELEDDILELTDPAPAGLHGDSETYSRAAPAVEAADEPPPCSTRPSIPRRRAAPLPPSGRPPAPSRPPTIRPRSAVLDGHPAAQRHRLAAHRPRAQQHPAGRAGPLRRMRGKAALWLPGTDHAGIATQMVVERQLAAEGNIGRRDWAARPSSSGLGVEGPVGRAIVNQLRRLGASCDWSRERFTLDEGLSAAVRKVFVTLHKQKLIYRDKRLVNWDPELPDRHLRSRGRDSARSTATMWHFAYPLEDGSGEIVVATTRPETMLGDTAVAVHPSTTSATRP